MVEMKCNPLSIVVMAICIVFYNTVHRLPIIKYYKDLKVQAVIEEKEERGLLTGFGVLIIYVATWSIFPSYITEDVHSQILEDWYLILLTTCYNVFDLAGKSLTATFLLENEKVAIGASVARWLF